MFPTPPHWATSRPPSRSAARRRANSVAWSAIQWNVAVERIASTVRPPRSRVVRSATTSSRSGRAPRRSRAAAIIDAEPSTPITRPRGRRSSSASVTRPEPQPASRTVSSPRERQALEHRAPHRLHRRREAVVVRPVPVASDRHGLYVITYVCLSVSPTHPVGRGPQRACSSRSPRTMRSTDVGRRADEGLDLGGGLAPATEHVARRRSPGRSSRDARRRPARGRSPATRSRAAATSGRCGPARPPPRRGRMSPNGRSISSCTTSTWSRSTFSAPRAGPADVPDSFMYVSGCSSADAAARRAGAPLGQQAAERLLRLAEIPAARELGDHLEPDVVRRALVLRRRDCPGRRRASRPARIRRTAGARDGASRRRRRRTRRRRQASPRRPRRRARSPPRCPPPPRPRPQARSENGGDGGLEIVEQLHARRGCDGGLERQHVADRQRRRRRPGCVSGIVGRQRLDVDLAQRLVDDAALLDARRVVDADQLDRDDRLDRDVEVHAHEVDVRRLTAHRMVLGVLEDRRGALRRRASARRRRRTPAARVRSSRASTANVSGSPSPP